MEQTPVNVFNQVYSAIGEIDKGAARKWKQRFPTSAAGDLDVKQQLSSANTFLRAKLAGCSFDTSKARSSLQDQMPVKEWLDGICKDVLPVVIKNNLLD